MIRLGDEVGDEFLRKLLVGGYLVPMPVRLRVEGNVIQFPSIPYRGLSPREDGGKEEKATAEIIYLSRHR